MNERFDLDATTEWRMMGLFLILASLVILIAWAFVRGWENLLVGFGGLGAFSALILPLLWIATRQRFNYAELRDDHLHVRWMGYATWKLPWPEISRVKPTHKHNVLYAFLMWGQGNGSGEHIDVTAVMPTGLGRFWPNRRMAAASGIHIAVKEQDRFLEALQQRIDATAGTPRSPIA